MTDLNRSSEPWYINMRDHQILGDGSVQDYGNYLLFFIYYFFFLN